MQAATKPFQPVLLQLQEFAFGFVVFGDQASPGYIRIQILVEQHENALSIVHLVHGFLKEHQISFVAVAMPKLFFNDAGSLPSVVDATSTS